MLRFPQHDHRVCLNLLTAALLGALVMLSGCRAFGLLPAACETSADCPFGQTCNANVCQGGTQGDGDGDGDGGPPDGGAAAVAGGGEPDAGPSDGGRSLDGGPNGDGDGDGDGGPADAGNGELDAGFLDGGVNPVCSNQMLDPGEDCDDGNLEIGDGCDDSCAVEDGYLCAGEPSACAQCADGIVEVQAGEQCDDGNTDSGDGCFECVIESGWVCTDDTIAPTICGFCGDGVWVPAVEGCDDDDAQGGDGCDAQCRIETGYSCAGSPGGTTTCTLPAFLDCTVLAANAGLGVCNVSATECEVRFDLNNLTNTACTDICASAGLACVKGYDNAGQTCSADPNEVTCATVDGFFGGVCVCGEGPAQVNDTGVQCAPFAAPVNQYLLGARRDTCVVGYEVNNRSCNEVCASESMLCAAATDYLPPLSPDYLAARDCAAVRPQGVCYCSPAGASPQIGAFRPPSPILDLAHWWPLHGTPPLTDIIQGFAIEEMSDVSAVSGTAYGQGLRLDSDAATLRTQDVEMATNWSMEFALFVPLGATAGRLFQMGSSDRLVMDVAANGADRELRVRGQNDDILYFDEQAIPISTEQWHYVRVSQDDFSMAIRVDGTIRMVTSLANLTGDGLRFGTDGDNLGANVQIDELRIYSRALSDEDWAVVDAVLPLGATALYGFDNDLKEVTGAGGAWSVGAGSVEYVMGMTGLGIGLDGNTYLEVPGAGVDLHQAYTITGAFITDKETTQSILYQNHPLEGAPIRFRLEAGTVTYSIADSVDVEVSTSISTTVTDGQWHWFVLRRTGDDGGPVTVDLWVDGQRAPQPVPVNLGNSDGGMEPLRLGERLPGELPEPFTGIIDSITYANRALSEAEIDNFNDTIASLR